MGGVYQSGPLDAREGALMYLLRKYVRQAGAAPLPEPSQPFDLATCGQRSAQVFDLCRAVRWTAKTFAVSPACRTKESGKPDIFVRQY